MSKYFANKMRSDKESPGENYTPEYVKKNITPTIFEKKIVEPKYQINKIPAVGNVDLIPDTQSLLEFREEKLNESQTLTEFTLDKKENKKNSLNSYNLVDDFISDPNPIKLISISEKRIFSVFPTEEEAVRFLNDVISNSSIDLSDILIVKKLNLSLDLK